VTAGRLAFLSERTWLDRDGQHVWSAHDCADGRETTMLPWPTWYVRDDGSVWPSISCDRCGAHYLSRIGDPENLV